VLRRHAGRRPRHPPHRRITVGAYHEVLCQIQRDNQDINITAIADDTYLNGLPTRVYRAYNDTRALSLSRCTLESKLSKVCAFAPNAEGGCIGMSSVSAV